MMQVSRCSITHCATTIHRGVDVQLHYQIYMYVRQPPLCSPFSDHELEKISYHVSGFVIYSVTSGNGWRSTVSTVLLLALIPRIDPTHTVQETMWTSEMV